MKKLSRKTVAEAAEVLNIGVRDDGSLFIVDHARDVLVPIKGKTKQLDLKSLGIQLEPEMPEITQENLCKFYLKEKRFPVAKLSNNTDLSNHIEGCVVYVDYEMIEAYQIEGGMTYACCEIIDSKWSCIEHESCELCEGVRS